MSFFYSIKRDRDDEVVINIPSPYIIEEYAIKYLQLYIKGQKVIMDLPNGKYSVTLCKEESNQSKEYELTNYFEKKASDISFLDNGMRHEC